MGKWCSAARCDARVDPPRRQTAERSGPAVDLFLLITVLLEQFHLLGS